MKKTLTILIIAGLASAITQTTQANFTSTDSVQIAGILDEVYVDGNAGFFQLFSPYDYYYGSINAIRAKDYDFRQGPVPINLLESIENQDISFTDQEWTSASAIAEARVVHTDNNAGQSFGYTSNPEWITGIGLENGHVTSSPPVPVNPILSDTWEWIYTNSSGSYSSNGTSDNMITYEITGLNNGYQKTWLLFWDGTGDGNFTDLVVEIKANPVPAPGAFLLGGIGIACVGWIKRRRTL